MPKKFSKTHYGFSFFYLLNKFSLSAASKNLYNNPLSSNSYCAYEMPSLSVRDVGSMLGNLSNLKSFNLNYKINII